ncbi:MAG: hypothetical protein AB8B80_02670 [Marinicellaceae bacterium]
MIFPPDLIEEQISNVDQAWQLLDKNLPRFKKLYNIWQDWYKSTVKNQRQRNVISDAMVISYARMAKRNGSLSINPRSYHGEHHLDDLLYRLMAVSHYSGAEAIPEYGWSLLSLFMCCHDLRQSEENHNKDLIGNNERASYQEVIRIIESLDKKQKVRPEHKELLKLMIHGSTFGKGEDNMGNIYKGNLVKYLLKDIAYFEQIDKEIAFIACDIDTANVSADLLDYGQSSIDVYNEIQNISKVEISAHSFFGELQEQYFFELQQFNSELGKQAFSEQKLRNAPKIKKICDAINNLDAKTSNEKVLEIYLSHINLSK